MRRSKSKPDELIEAAIRVNRERKLQSAEKKLKAKKFAGAFLKTNNVSKAAQEVGISPQMGKELLYVPEVRAEIEEGISAAARAAGVSRQWVLENLKAIAERCMQAQPVLDKFGRETGMYVFDASGANRSIELIGKHLKVFDDGNAATQIGQAVIRALAQEAQAARIAKAVDTTQERVPPVEGQDSLAPGSASGRPAITEEIAPVSTPILTPPVSSPDLI